MEGGDTGSPQVNQTPGLLKKIYIYTPKASNLINKGKANDNEPPDIYVKSTHQLIMKPLYPRLLQLKLNIF